MLDLEGTVTCEACQAINRDDARECVECGTSLGDDAARALEARRAASQDLKRGYRWIGAVGSLYRLGAAGYAAGTLAAIAALSRPEVPLGDGLLIVVLFSAMTVTMLMGAIQILFHPFWWTLVVALLASATAAVHAFGPNPLGIALFWSAGWALAFWASVVPTFLFERVSARHMDLFVTHHASRATRRSLEGRSPKQRHERLVRALRRASRRAWRLSVSAGAIVALAAALGTYLVRTNVRPNDVLNSIERFEEQWNASDLAGVSAFFPARHREAQETWLEGTMEGHGWAGSLPSLGTRHLDNGEARVEVEYAIGALALKASWALDEQTWYLTRLALPAPPFRPALDRFLEAWRRSDAEALADFFSEKNRDSMLRSITDAAHRREWTDYPSVREVRGAEGATASDTEVVLALDRGEVRLQWRLRPDGRWGLRHLTFPPP